MRYFSDEEFKERLNRVKNAMSEAGYDACIITNPENIYYLTGLNHQGYFAYTALIVSQENNPILIMREMEKQIVADMVIPEVTFFPYLDGVAHNSQDSGTNAVDYSDPSAVTCQALHDLNLTNAQVAFEKNSSFLPYRIAEGFVKGLPNVSWHDADNLINDCRAILSEGEIACTREAARITDSMIMSAVAIAGKDVANRTVAAQVYSAMIQRGGTYPAFVPLIRSTRTRDHEHGTWDNDLLESGDHLFLEMSGCHWRYHAPAGRLVHIEQASSGADKTNKACVEAEAKVVETIKPGVTANDVYQAWKRTIDKHGFEDYHRHHCGYMVGIGYPPSWSGSGVPRSLRNGSDMVLKEGMVFHLLSWLMRTGRGDSFVSDTVVVTKNGCEFLTNAPRELTVR